MPCHVATTGYISSASCWMGCPMAEQVIEWYGSNPCPGGKLPDPGCTLSLCVVGTPTNKKHGCSDTDGCTRCQRGRDHFPQHTRTLSLQQHICPGLAHASGDIQFHTYNTPSRPGQTPGGSSGRSGDAGSTKSIGTHRLIHRSTIRPRWTIVFAASLLSGYRAGATGWVARPASHHPAASRPVANYPAL